MTKAKERNYVILKYVYKALFSLILLGTLTYSFAMEPKSIIEKTVETHYTLLKDKSITYRVELPKLESLYLDKKVKIYMILNISSNSIAYQVVVNTNELTEKDLEKKVKGRTLKEAIEISESIMEELGKLLDNPIFLGDKGKTVELLKQAKNIELMGQDNFGTSWIIVYMKDGKELHLYTQSYYLKRWDWFYGKEMKESVMLYFDEKEKELEIKGGGFVYNNNPGIVTPINFIREK